uniref:Uncharacterized protein n=1 Tax=Laticauda laticaudata TaxID=8630 RepID=A0A8C5SL52_LATLA
MAVSAGVSGWSGLRLACACLRSFFGLFLLLGLAPHPGAATTHWVVTEDGKIQQQVRGRGFQVDAKNIPFGKYFSRPLALLERMGRADGCASSEPKLFSLCHSKYPRVGVSSLGNFKPGGHQLPEFPSQLCSPSDTKLWWLGNSGN